MVHGPIVEFLQQRANGLVETGKREETPVAQTRQDPALDLSLVK